MFPGGAAREANVATSRTAADEMPRQLGPRSRAPCANRCEQGPLAFLAFRADLREPAEILTANPRIEDGLDRLSTGPTNAGRQTTARSMGSGMSPMVLYPRTPATDSPFQFTGYGTPATALEDVAEELASDRAPARRGAEHRDGLRLEERTERRDDRSVITFLDERCVTDGGSDRERHLDLAAAEFASLRSPLLRRP